MGVEIHLLGGFTVVVDGRRVPDEAWRRRHAAWLVKYLALAPNRTRHREQVIDALWPDVSVEEASPRLHKAAHFARRAVGLADALVLRGDAVSLLPDADVLIDADVFEQAVDAAVAAGTRAAADAALDHYGGDLLPQDRYEPWAEERREHLRLRHLDLLRRAERWEDLVLADPADEEAHLALMVRYAKRGDRRAALRQFERMDKALRRELGVGPGDTALKLRDEMLAVGVDTPASEVEDMPIGRADECARLEATLDSAATGGTTVVLGGAPGAGKSHLLAWLAHRARDRGWRVGRGSAAAFEGAWPYAPVLEALADLARAHADALDALDPLFREEIERALAGQELHWTGDSGHQRLFVATAEVVRAASHGGGVMLTIDDAHEADDASLRLLHYLARTLRDQHAVIVLARRTGTAHPALDQIESSLAARRAAQQVTLGPVSLADARAILASEAPGLPDALVEHVWELADGLPFGLLELARRADSSAATPASLAEGAVASLAQATRAVLQRVAVLGASFDTDEFVALSDLDEADAFSHLDAALAARAVEATGSGYRFRHQLIRDALLDGMPPHRRRAVHRDAARRLEALGASPAQIARHLLLADEPAAAVPFALRAAETEAALGAFRDALALVEPVLAHAQGPARADLLALRADLLAAIGSPSAIHAYRQAIDANRSRRRLLRARLARAAVMAGDLATAQQAVAGLEPAGDDADPAVLIAQGMVRYFTGDLDGAAAATEAARARVADGAEGWRLLDLVALQGLIAHNVASGSRACAPSWQQRRTSRSSRPRCSTRTCASPSTCSTGPRPTTR